MLSNWTEGRTFISSIDTVEELLGMDSMPKIPANQRYFDARDTNHDSRPSWTGGTRAEVRKALRDGWPVGAATVLDLVEQLRPLVKTPLSFKRRQRWSEDGDEPSWEREQQGHTEIWRTAHRTSTRGPVTVELLAPWGGLAYHSASDLMWDGVVLLVLTSLLEEAGYRVGATLNSCGFLDGGNSWVTQMEVKRPEMPLDVASLVPVVAHPGTFRIWGINARSLAPFSIAGSGWGRTSAIQLLPPVSVLHRPGAIVLNHSYSSVAAITEVVRVLALFE